MTATTHASALFLPTPALSSAHTWQGAAEQLRQVLAKLEPQQRRQILDYINRLPEAPKLKSYPIRDCMRAARRVAELLQAHRHWTQARARRETARELGISTVQLRRMLKHVNS